MRFFVALAWLLASLPSPSYASNRAAFPSAPHSDLVRRCSQHLSETLDPYPAGDLLADWEWDLENALALPLQSKEQVQGSKLEGSGWFWRRSVERAFVRSADFLRLSARQQLTLYQRARALRRGVYSRSLTHFPILYGPQAMTKGELTDLLLGTTDDETWHEWGDKMLEADRISSGWFVQTAITMFGALGISLGTASLSDGLPRADKNIVALVGLAGAVPFLGFALQGVIQSWRADRYFAACRRHRAELGGNPIAGFISREGPFRDVAESDAFRSFAQTASTDWHTHRLGDPPMWWYFHGTQKNETVDLLVRTIEDNDQDLDVLLIVPPL